MKKICCTIAISVFIINSLLAQIKVGFGFGSQSASVIEKNDLPGWKANYKNFYSARKAFHVGLVAQINIDQKGDWVFQPSAMYYAKGRNFSKSYDSALTLINDTSSINASWKLNYIDVPLNIVYRYPLSSHVRIILGAGPYFSFFLNGRTSYEVRNVYGEYSSLDNKLPAGDDVNSYKKINWGMNGLIGFDFNERLMLTGNFSRSISSFYEADYSGSFNHRVYGVSLVFWLNSSSKVKTINPAIADRDKDGIPDDQDACPDEPGSQATNGCPDKDGDGIPDNKDKCPNVAGLLKYQGCPVPDTDGDGIDDDKDSCVTVPGSLIYHGCPVPDSDGDGIKDSEDKCPNQAGLAKYNGCPAPDTDGDGINDLEDKCPTKPGDKAHNGCPVVQDDLNNILKSIAHSILFGVSSDKIDPKSFEYLDKLAGIMEKDQALKLGIEGHTDNTGARKYNQILSGKRALAIKAYLIQKGINKDRMTASGYGPDKPIASNNTEKGRKQNRRVELKLKY
jgi:OOP family OmpA-OmpF porin